MSTKIEPFKKYVARDEKSKLFTFLSVIAYGKHGNVVGLLILKYFLNPPKIQTFVTVPRPVKNTQNEVTHTVS